MSRASDFELIAVFDDDRRDYGERRRRAYGLIDGLTYYLAYTIRGRIRAISLRRAHAKEFRRHVR
ncbi:MAG: BrnT family toxin [Brevundimonas sp.]|uniref:BrnT family toxin n=1 Tax=Brevundimonas sp. TaxID=1871086 RepID=UPI00391CCB07